MLNRRPRIGHSRRYFIEPVALVAACKMPHGHQQTLLQLSVRFEFCPKIYSNCSF